MSLMAIHFPFMGGLNLESPPLATAPGELIDCSNYECLPNGGYRRIDGYALFDGQVVSTQPVPGSGPVLGVHVYKGETYAIREDGTNGRLYKATNTGWVEVDNLFTWSPGGAYNFCNYNFYGQDAQEEMFIANGVDSAVKFDGTTLVQIATGAAVDTPSLVIGHKFHLFLAIQSSIVFSATGSPVDYIPGNGAGEISVGDSIRDLVVARGALIIGCEDSSSVLYGTDSTDFVLDRMSKAGIYTGTISNIGGQVIGLDRQGVMSLNASAAYGNFDYSSLTRKVQKLANSFGAGSVGILNKRRNQYRLFNGKVGLRLTFSGTGLIGITRTVFDHTVTCACNGLDADRNEVSFFGSDDGNVYQLDGVNKFNGVGIYSFLVTSFHSYKGATRNNRFRLVQPDMRIEGEAAILGIRGTTDYGGGFVSRVTTPAMYATGGALWDFTSWDNFTWDSIYHHDAKARLSLTGTNMAVIISSDGAADGTHEIYGATVHYSQRRLKR